MLPNFMIIGAMKSGTTSLWRYLTAHPDIFMTSVKEPGFFVEELARDRGWDWYRSLYAEGENFTAVGEGSTHYTKAPHYGGVPGRICEAFPEMRFIYLMRNPVARTISHYWHAVDYNHETRSLDRAIHRDPIYTDVSRYAMQIELYLSHFPRSQFYFTHFERLQKEPESVIRECFEFLGVDPSFKPGELGEVFNKGRSSVRKTNSLLHSLRWSGWWDQISPLVPQSLKDSAKSREYSQVNRNQPTSRKTFSYLRSVFDEENERLFSLLGERFEEWEQFD